ncbi:helix-turn-helix transcriptional regulator [Niveispirillum sp. KHB5.9]|uniref:helix-turn-helix transcriptional regulator n=1 Tax=Niveispirillum sp. KHB5.9 TaxID=3400269 RepID=UPI003A88563B
MRRVSTRQIKAARILLNLSQEDLADRAKVSRSSVYRFEHGNGITLEIHFRIVAALEDAGVEFITPESGKGEGLRLAGKAVPDLSGMDAHPPPRSRRPTIPCGSLWPPSPPPVYGSNADTSSLATNSMPSSCMQPVGWR